MTTKKEKEATEVAKTGGSALAVNTDYGDYAGMGHDQTSSDDYLIPYINLLQDLSPQCKAGEDKLEGAVPGLMFNTASETLHSELCFVPVERTHSYLEFVPRKQGGGFKGEHSPESDLVRHCINTQEWGEYKTPGGNELVETYALYGFQMDGPEDYESAQPVVISFTSTKIKEYKKLMTRMRTFKGGKGIPLFAHRILLTTALENRTGGDSFNFRSTPAVNKSVAESLIPMYLEDGKTIHPMMEMGAAFLQEIRSGARKADHNSSQGQDSSAPSDPGF